MDFKLGFIGYSSILFASMLLSACTFSAGGEKVEAQISDNKAWDSLSQKDKGLIGKCGGGISANAKAGILLGLKNKSLTGEISKDQNVLAPILKKDGDMTEVEYNDYTKCLKDLDPDLVATKAGGVSQTATVSGGSTSIQSVGDGATLSD